MTDDLRDTTVLVTRPEQQQQNFIALLQKENAHYISLPCIGIRHLSNSSALHQLKALEPNQIIVFTSANAVHAAHNLLPMPWPQLCTDMKQDNHCVLLATGPATAAALASHGLFVSHAPIPPYNSEALLSMASLKGTNLQKVSIITGKGGRDYITQSMQKRARKAETIEVYERFKPDIEEKTVEGIFLKSSLDIVTITSNEALRNLFEIVKLPLRERLLGLPLIVNSHRGAQLAKDLCFKSHVLVADAAGDAGQLAAIKLWNRSYRFNYE